MSDAIDTVAEVLLLAGGLVALLAGLGLLRFSTSFARFHAAGKASPFALLLAALGAGFLLDGRGAAHLALASGAMVLTLPVAVHLLFRAVHQSSPDQLEQLVVDQLTVDRARQERQGSPDQQER